MNSLRVGLVGATGIVGQTFIKLIEERGFPVTELRPFASPESMGRKLKLNDKEFTIQCLTEKGFENLDIVFFSSGDEISQKWAPRAVEAGAWAIDNSAAFRLNDEHELVVPEINYSEKIGIKPCIIANPNCSTIQLVMLLNALKDYQLKAVRVATYQAVSGAGRDAIEELKNAEHSAKCFRHPIASNCLPEIGSFDKSGFSSEENKIRLETKKILNMKDLPVSAFTVRVPVTNAHAEAVWVEFDQDIGKDQLVQAIGRHPGLVVETETEKYHTQQEADQRDAVFVSRIHKDPEIANCWLFWVVADNLRKGAALNGIQIAEKIAQQISK